MNQEIEFVLWRAQQQKLLEIYLRESDLAAYQPLPRRNRNGVGGYVQRLARWVRLAEPRVGMLNFSDLEDWR